MYFFKREKYFEGNPLFGKRIVSNAPRAVPISPWQPAIDIGAAIRMRAAINALAMGN